MTTFYCLLGNTPDLSLLELNALLGAEQVNHVSAQVAAVQLADEAAARQLMEISGGIVKITQDVQVLPSSQPAEIEQAITEYLVSLGLPKVTIGVAEIGRDHHQPLSLTEIKKQLHAQGVNARYIESPRAGLSASVLSHHSNVIELVVLPINDEWHLTKTVAVQDIDSWTERDRAKPYADRRKGMLPPKVARMMVNLALGELGQEATASQPVIYDPFCGTGTVLLEAMVRGCGVIGSDLDIDAVKGTEENLAWFKEIDELKLPSKVFMSDVTRVPADQVGQRVDAIVTEPFLGKPSPRPEQVPGIFKGLGKLYLGAFKQWRSILRPNGVVVIVFPYIQLGNRTFSLEFLIDKLANLGYTLVSEPVLYHRPQATVQRQIHVFRYQADQES